MGRIKEAYIQIKRDHPNWDEEDMPYLFEQYVKQKFKNMEEKEVFEIHRSTAIDLLLGTYRSPQIFTNLQLADMLEEEFESKNRAYLVKEDHLELNSTRKINNVNEF